MVGWVVAVASLVTVLVTGGLFVGFGAVLSGTPRPSVGVGVAAGALVSAAVASVAAVAVGWWAWDTGIYGPKYPFDLRVPDDYRGEVALEFCGEGPPLRGVVEVGDDGIASLRGPTADEAAKYRIDVHRRDGRSARAHRTQALSGGAGCGYVVFAVADEDVWRVPMSTAAPEEIVALARREHLTYAQAGQRLTTPEPPLAPPVGSAGHTGGP